MNYPRIVALFLALLALPVLAEKPIPQGLAAQVDHLAHLLQIPGYLKEDPRERQWTKISHDYVVVFSMNSVGGNGSRQYLALFHQAPDSFPPEPFVFEGMVTLPSPEWLEMGKLRASIKSGILSIQLYEKGGLSSERAKVSVWRYAIERPNGWGLTLLPD